MTLSTPPRLSRSKKRRRSSATALPRLLAVLKRRAIEFKLTPTIGRTHGIHAEPTTFGLKLLNWYAEMERNATRFAAAAEDMRVGKLSGAVGTFGHLKPEHEERICARAGTQARAGCDAGHPARSPRSLHRHARHHRQHARQDCRRNPPPAAHRGSRGAGVLQRKAKRLLVHAAQKEPDHERANQRPGARPSRQLAGGHGEHSALARARHLSFFCRAHHLSGLDHSRRLSAGQDRRPG